MEMEIGVLSLLCLLDMRISPRSQRIRKRPISSNIGVA
jgi:hypothetical protein